MNFRYAVLNNVFREWESAQVAWSSSRGHSALCHSKQ